MAKIAIEGEVKRGSTSPQQKYSHSREYGDGCAENPTKTWESVCREPHESM